MKIWGVFISQHYTWFDTVKIKGTLFRVLEHLSKTTFQFPHLYEENDGKRGGYHLRFDWAILSMMTLNQYTQLRDYFVTKPTSKVIVVGTSLATKWGYIPSGLTLLVRILLVSWISIVILLSIVVSQSWTTNWTEVTSLNTKKRFLQKIRQSEVKWANQNKRFSELDEVYRQLTPISAEVPMTGLMKPKLSMFFQNGESIIQIDVKILAKLSPKIRYHFSKLSTMKINMAQSWCEDNGPLDDQRERILTCQFRFII